jgi:IS5 family transposase
VTETDIALPVDARLLNDSVRVMSRHLQRLREVAPQVAFRFHNHTRRAKKRAYQIVMGKGKNVEKRRRKLYEDLLKVQAKVRGYAEAAVAAVHADDTAANDVEVMACVVELERVRPLCERVWDQARRRVILGEALPADEKLVSIFQTHTDIICRGKKGSKTEFGHKVAYATGRSGLVTYYEVFDGNPGDNEVLDRALDDHARLFGRAPKHVTGDRRYHSQANERMAGEKGVERVALPKPGHLNKARKTLQKQPWFRRLLRWRAGIEGNLSTLLRTFGLKRCLWKGWESFRAYVGLSVLTYNLRLLAGHLCNA